MESALTLQTTRNGTGTSTVVPLPPIIYKNDAAMGRRGKAHDRPPPMVDAADRTCDILFRTFFL
jgi:hypothetical protein